MISYAQNFEDVLLWRALKDVGAGTYIDIGGWHPDSDSVTKWFYDNGWSGITVEPIDELHALFEKARPRDINLQLAIGAASGEAELHVFDATGLSTLDAELALRQQGVGRIGKISKVRVEPLTKICDEHLAGQTVHFLKIDVEGAELAVLEGLDLARIRPWIILLEAVDPLTHMRNDGLICEHLAANGYRFVWFDGLNSFFVADERSYLSERIALPPNIFDGFAKVSEVAAQSGDSAAPVEQAASGPDAAVLLTRQLSGIEGMIRDLPAKQAASGSDAMASLSRQLTGIEAMIRDLPAKQAASWSDAMAPLSGQLSGIEAMIRDLFARQAEMADDIRSGKYWIGKRLEVRVRNSWLALVAKLRDKPEKPD